MTKAAVITLVIVLSALVGFAAGRSNGTIIKTVPDSSGKPTQVTTTESLQAAVNPLFKTQSATFQGKIVSIAGKNISVEAENGQKGEFGLSDNIIIYKFPNNSATASSSSDIKQIDTGKLVLISLNLINNKYQAVSISYFRTP